MWCAYFAMERGDDDESIDDCGDGMMSIEKAAIALEYQKTLAHSQQTDEY